jgi:hypothetical protein
VVGTCIADTSGSGGLLSFKWFKNDKQISSNSIKMLDEMSVLTLNPVQAADQGNYTCLAENDYGSNQASATFNLTGN